MSTIPYYARALSAIRCATRWVYSHSALMPPVAALHSVAAIRAGRSQVSSNLVIVLIPPHLCIPLQVHHEGVHLLRLT